jgi:hypothetical protein
MMAAKKHSTPNRKRSGGQSGGGNPRNDRASGPPKILGRAHPRHDDKITEAEHDDAMRVLRAEYYQGVRTLAETVASLVKDEGMDESDALHQTVDGSYWVIYTHANFQVLMCSDHHDAYSEDFGEPPVSGNDINWAALAYAAMARDVSEQVDAEGLEEAPQGRSAHAPRRALREGRPPLRRGR